MLSDVSGDETSGPPDHRGDAVPPLPRRGMKQREIGVMPAGKTPTPE
jgi:hypothetical protein